MADRVHPRNTSPLSQTTPSRAAVNSSPAHVINVPKDQLHRVPPPEYARRYANYTRREKPRQCRCCCCLCWFITIFVVLVILLAVAAGVFYLVFRPEAPGYAIESVAVKGMNSSYTSPSSAAAVSPEFDISFGADNENDKIGIYYESGSSVEMFFNDARLCDGALPAFYQPSNNVTVFGTVLTGNGIELTESDQMALVKAVAKRNVPLMLKMRVPVRVKVGCVKTWKITVKVNCDVTVDQLTAQARIVNKDCSYRVDFW